MINALKNSSELLNDLNVGVVLHNPATEILFINDSALKMLQLTREQALGADAMDPWWNFLDEFKQPLALNDYPINQVLSTQKPLKNLTVGITKNDGKTVTWVMVNGYPNFDQNHQIAQVTITFIDITDKKLDIPFEAIVSHANDIVLVTEAGNIEGPNHPKIVYVNHAFCQLTGYQRHEVIGKTPRILQGKDTSAKAKHCIRQALQKKEPITCQLLNYTKSGEPYWIEISISPLKNSLGEVAYFAAIERNITVQKLHELKLEEEANTDFLTQLPNRKNFIEKATQLLKDGTQYPISMAMIDIDFFKNVNDNFGHDAGDLILKQLGQLLKQNFRKTDYLVRLGGEEFGILLPNTECDMAFNLLEEFRRLISQRDMPVGEGHSLRISLSIGVYSAKNPNETLTKMLKHADDALYLAKNAGRNQTQRFKATTI
ncbi:sensor domain-containing diguanylate cyclase [Thiomicrorhabdus sp. Milos-T2]|uniref:sensor domain-containing diguanylate cyclase n=1 Tax=Thiomicrorhabdus sp. Milos-T2 TaxID=90814 RepID=UPI00049471F9|nr:sensor domain-containing diguanylate cyclase [Thiomicrorhabdus sp. Milos-T2]